APPREGPLARRGGAPLPREPAALAAEDAHARRDAGRGQEGPAAQLGPAPRGAQAAARSLVRSGARLDWAERRRLDSRPERVPLDRRRPGPEPRPPGLSGRDALAGQLRSPGRPRPRVRGAAVVDLHPRLDRAPDQRASPPRRLCAPAGARSAVGAPAAADLRPLLPPLADLPRPQPVRPPGYVTERRRFSHLGRDGGFDARLPAGPPPRPD